jgi:hypothetical protein
MVRSITQKTKGKAKERPKDEQQPIGTKEGRELVPRGLECLCFGPSYFTTFTPWVN